MADCPAALNIKGEHFACDIGFFHPDLAHSNSDAEAIWTEDKTQFIPTDPRA